MTASGTVICGAVPPAACMEERWLFPLAAMAPKIGMALAFNASGQLAASATPKYICLRAGSAVTAGTVIPVLRIDKGMKFEACLDAATAFKAGTVAQITSDGLMVDADGSTGGVFQIVELDGTAAGSTVRGYFTA